MDFANTIKQEMLEEDIRKNIQNRIERGSEECTRMVELIEKRTIRDILVNAGGAVVYPSTTASSGMSITYGDEENSYKIHRHALSQITEKVSIPASYVNRLNTPSVGDWKRKCLSNDIQAHYKNYLVDEPARYTKKGSRTFLHRIVAGELRGFLSSRYNRNMSSAPMLVAFLGACEIVGAAPYAAYSSDIKFSLKCFLPHVFKVGKEFACFGVAWGNSDFGAGKMYVSPSVWLPTKKNGGNFMVLDQAISKVHIGSVLEESDIELSEDTLSKEAAAQAGAIKDCVIGSLGPDAIEKTIASLEEAQLQEVPWHTLQKDLKRFLSKEDVKMVQDALDNQIQELPQPLQVGERIVPSRWWAARAISWIAAKEDDIDRKADLEREAGKFLV